MEYNVHNILTNRLYKYTYLYLIVTYTELTNMNVYFNQQIERVMLSSPN